MGRGKVAGCRQHRAGGGRAEQPLHEAAAMSWVDAQREAHGQVVMCWKHCAGSHGACGGFPSAANSCALGQ